MKRLMMVTAIAIAMPTQADTLFVPQQFSSIQQAIDAAQDGDVIEVGSGTYIETLDFFNKEITVRSTGGPASTFINGLG